MSCMHSPIRPAPASRWRASAFLSCSPSMSPRESISKPNGMRCGARGLTAGLEFSLVKRRCSSCSKQAGRQYLALCTWILELRRETRFHIRPGVGHPMLPHERCSQHCCRAAANCFCRAGMAGFMWLGGSR
jgi:hypothetical protein